MPCWYYTKKQLQSSPSIRDGIDFETESRYKREGARFINEAGQKLGLHHDTCATGVVYFHRFYMYHSFRDFYRYVMATTCLFLAGKVEETPKKCKDIIKAVRSILPDQQFAFFGEDPKEEVMTMERILLQTIKFDLQIEHPYSFLLKYAKTLRGDKAKVQKMVQMSWTFINDSYCTSLCLQWEPEIIAVSLMYLASRLNKFEITDWQDKPAGYKGKWWDQFVENMTLELMEDICHQVLDLYSQNSQSQKRGESPPLKSGQDVPPPPPAARKHPRSVTPTDSAGAHPSKMARHEPPSMTDIQTAPNVAQTAGNQPADHHQQQTTYAALPSSSSYNPYVSTQMYSSSFMNQEGLQNISSLMAGNPSTQEYASGQYPQPTTYTQYTTPQQPGYQQPPSTQSGYGSYQQPSLQQYSAYNQAYSQQQPPPAQSFPTASTGYPYPSQNYNQPPPQQFPPTGNPPSFPGQQQNYPMQQQAPPRGQYEQQQQAGQLKQDRRNKKDKRHNSSNLVVLGK